MKVRGLILTILTVVMFFPGCADDEPVPPGPFNPRAVEIINRIEDLFSGAFEEEALERFDLIQDEVEGGQEAQAIEDALALIGFLQDRLESGDLEDPAGAETTEEAAAALAAALLEFVGFTDVAVPPEALEPSGAVGVLNESGGNVTTANNHAGLSLPPGALSRAHVFVLRNIPETGVPGDHEGPLPTSLDQYPLFYDIVTSPPVGELAIPGLVGLCVVDPPDPFAPDPAIAGRLLLAHPDPDNPAEIEILPRAEVPFLDCAGASTQTGLTPAGPGKLGGAILAFSPFAAVDPGAAGTIPIVVSVELADTVSTAPGSEELGTVAFTDPDANVVEAIFIEVADPDSVFTGGFQFDPEVFGQGSGSFQFRIFCPAGGNPCDPGTVTLGLVLRDAAENRSQQVDFTFVFAP